MPDLIRLQRMYSGTNVLFMKIVKITGSGMNARKETVYDGWINNIPAANAVNTYKNSMIVSYHVNIKESKVTAYIV